MKRVLSLLLNEEEPLIHLSLLFGMPAWFFLGLAFLSAFSNGVIYLVLAFVLAILGTGTGLVSLGKCKRKGLAWFVMGFSGTLLGFLIIDAIWVVSRLSDLH